MQIQAYDKTINKDSRGMIKSMTVAFINSPVMIHFRLNRFGITSYKVRPDRGMVKGAYETKPFERAAQRLVFELTEKTTWLRKPKEKGIDKVDQEFTLVKV